MDSTERQFVQTAINALCSLIGYWDGIESQVKINRGKIRAFKTNVDNLKVSQNKVEGGIAYSPKEEELKHDGKTITRRSDGRWWSRYYDANGVQRSVYGKTQRECYEKLKAALKQVKIEKQSPCTLKSPIIDANGTFGSYLQKWYDLFRVGKLSPDTADNEKNIIRAIESSIGKLKLKQLTPVILQDFINTATSGPRQKEHFYNVLRLSLSKAVEINLIKSNPLIGVEKPKHRPAERKAFDHLTETRFMEKASTCKYNDYMALLLFEGLRPSELLALYPSDVNFESMSITVDKATSKNGIEKIPKTDAAYRKIPIFKRALPILKKVITDKAADERIFPFNIRNPQKEFLKISKEIGLKGYSLYSFRHTFITRCAEQGVHVKVAQKWAGHKNVEITMKHYTHVNTD